MEVVMININRDLPRSAHRNLSATSKLHIIYDLYNYLRFPENWGWTQKFAQNVLKSLRSAVVKLLLQCCTVQFWARSRTWIFAALRVCLMHIHTPACEACKLAFKLFSCNLETCRDRFSRTFFSFLALRSSNICNTCKKSIFFTFRRSILMGHKTLLTYVDFTVVLPRKIFFCCTSANSCVTELEDKTKSDHDQNGDIRHDPASASSSSPSGSKKWRQDWRGWWAWNHHHYKSVAWVGFSLA